MNPRYSRVSHSPSFSETTSTVPEPPLHPSSYPSEQQQPALPADLIQNAVKLPTTLTWKLTKSRELAAAREDRGRGGKEYM